MCSKFSDGRSCPEIWLRLLEDAPALPSLPYIFGSRCSASSSLHVQTPLPVPAPPSQSFQVQLLLIFPSGKAHAAGRWDHLQRGVVRTGQPHPLLPSHILWKEHTARKCVTLHSFLLSPLARSQGLHVIYTGLPHISRRSNFKVKSTEHYKSSQYCFSDFKIDS